MSDAMKWQPMETAPVDDMVILDVGLPYAVVGAWNDYEQMWLYTELGINRGGANFNAPLFTNIAIKNKNVKGWMPLPEVAHEPSTR